MDRGLAIVFRVGHQVVGGTSIQLSHNSTYNKQQPTGGESIRLQSPSILLVVQPVHVDLL